MPQVPSKDQNDVLNNLAGVGAGNSGVSFTFPTISYLG
jgi:hypothetical protein